MIFVNIYKNGHNNNMQTKNRLTISLDKKILLKLDGYIKTNNLSNRSHAIEHIINQHLGTAVKQCVILAGGKTKTQCLSPLLRIHNRPVIAYQIDKLKNAGIKDLYIVINSAYQNLKQYLGDGKQWGINIIFILDKKNIGRAHALWLCKKYLTETFLLFYGDILSEVDLLDFIDFHQKQNHPITTIAVASSRFPKNFDVCRTKGPLIVEYYKKNAASENLRLVNTGMIICEPKIFNFLPESILAKKNLDVFHDLAQRQLLYGYIFDGWWFDMSFPQEHALANEKWYK